MNAPAPTTGDQAIAALGSSYLGASVTELCEWLAIPGPTAFTGLRLQPVARGGPGVRWAVGGRWPVHLYVQ